MIYRVTLLLVCAGLTAGGLLLGQQPGSSNPSTSPLPGNPSASANPAAQIAQPPQEPYIIEDGGTSIEPIYWLNRAQPSLYGGADATAYGNLAYPGDANPSFGGEIAIPAGRSNSLRFSYFRAQGHADTTLTQDATIVSESYVAGDYLNSNYLVQNAKISWDYLSYTWHKSAGAIRFKTLYEVQLVNIGTNVTPPYKAPTTDSSGNTDYYDAQGSKSLILPTLGAKFGQRVQRHFRWEVKASGFGIPPHADIWDVEGSIAARFAKFELLADEKAYHYKTNPQSEEYFVNTMSGAYVGIRYYWNNQE